MRMLEEIRTSLMNQVIGMSMFHARSLFLLSNGMRDPRCSNRRDTSRTVLWCRLAYCCGKLNWVGEGSDGQKEIGLGKFHDLDDARFLLLAHAETYAIADLEPVQLAAILHAKGHFH